MRLLCIALALVALLFLSPKAHALAVESLLKQELVLVCAFEQEPALRQSQDTVASWFGLTCQWHNTSNVMTLTTSSQFDVDINGVSITVKLLRVRTPNGSGYTMRVSLPPSAVFGY